MCRISFIFTVTVFALLLCGVTSLRAKIPPAVVSDRADLSKAFPGAVVESLPGDECAVVFPPSVEIAPFADPYYRGNFDGQVYVYARRFESDAGRSGLVRAITIYYRTDDKQARVHAEETARLYARLETLFRSHLKRNPLFGRGSDEAQVYLVPDHPQQESMDVGARTRDHSVYVFDTERDSTARTPLEWVRTLVHEWGHLTLPAARGFTAPENDAAGFLGERLFLKWLREAQSNPPQTEDRTSRADLDLYYQRQVAPLITRYQKTGPQSKELEGNDTAAMDYYIGAILASDEAFGSSVIGDALFSVEDVHPHDFLRALQLVLVRAYTKRGKENLTVHLPAWVLFEHLTVGVRPEASGVSGSLAIADRPPILLRSNIVASVLIRFPGWKWVRATSGNLQTILLHEKKG